jgi:TonB family protein
MQKPRKENSFIKKAFYKGGSKAMGEFLGKNLRYPANALDAKIEGTVSLRLDIDYKGNVINAKSIAGPGYGCHEEAERVAKLLKFEVPKNPQNLKILYHHNLNIHFRLPKKSDKPNIENPVPQPQQSLQYTFVTTPQKTVEEMKKKQETYQYTVKLG